MTIVFDTLFYWIHRLFHTSWLYKNFHKQHHEYKVAVSISTIYNHPFDFLLSNILPSVIAFTLLGKMHIITSFLWTFYICALAVTQHVGYDLPWFPWDAFFFGMNINYHDYHHSANVGNYGIFSTFWDAICGTNKHYYKYIAIEADKNS